MTTKDPTKPVTAAFRRESLRIPIDDILPLRVVTPAIKASRRYTQIAASISEVGIVEPPIVAPDRTTKGKYLPLDGHLRLAILRDHGATDVVCLLSTDDEAFTYNKGISRIAIVQEHKMIVKAIERGVSEQRIAKALDVDVPFLRAKIRLLKGICPEVADLLKDKHISMNAMSFLRRVAPLRRIEAAELMAAMNKFTANYAQSLLAATPRNQLIEPDKPKRIKGLSEKQIGLMQRESANLDRQFKLIEKSYGADHLNLVLVNGYVAKLLGNSKVVRFLAQHYAEILVEFLKLVDVKSAAT
ncbi:MAG: plasmid partitioning protein RepB C-terminal domain-containing protein [Hyphomicrobiaceae bacterium]|nr:plasmid partitioning protein RepB C-terminal domain-containing protein [Hyphomicrobiaceae bacterium]